MTGFWAWFRGKISRSRSPSPRTASPGRPAPPKDGPRPLPDPQDLHAISEPLRPEHDSRVSAPSSQPPSYPSPEDISIPVISPGPNPVSSPAHPASTLSGTQSDSRTSDVNTVIQSKPSAHVAPSGISPRDVVDTALRLGQSAAEVFPPAKAAIAGVIEILKIVDVSCIVFHLYS